MREPIAHISNSGLARQIGTTRHSERIVATQASSVPALVTMSSHTPVGRLEFLRTLSLSEEERATVPVSTKGKFEWMNARYPMILLPAFPSVSEVRNEATERSGRIFRDWESLHSILNKHEDVLRKRWIKKSQDQRKRILLTAWPNMATTHRPDFRALREEPTEQRRRNATRFRNEYLYPYINLEDLVKGHNLLLFFHSRGRNVPHVFSSFDRKTYRLGLTCNAIQQSFLEGYTMMLNGQTSPTTYGRLLDWSLHEEAQNLMKIGIGDQPGEGLVTLEIQEKILRFLVECAEIILHDLLPLIKSSTSVPQSLPPPTSHHTDTEWPSLAAVVAEAPYQVPKQFDFSGIRSLVMAKRAEAEDHIWSLREDPGYFQDAVSEWSEHRGERLLDLNGKRHPDLNKPVFWENVLDLVITDAYSNLVMWDLAQKELSYIVKIREHHGSRINPNQRMPADYEIALCHFRNLVERMRFAPLTVFQQGISSSPPLRKYYRRKQFLDGRMGVVVLPEKRRDDYLLWLIERFRIEGHVELYGLSKLLDELERLTRSNSVIAGAPQIQYISPWIATALSGLAVVGELERQLNLHQPPIPRSLPEKELDVEFDKRTVLNDVMFKAGREGKFADAGTPLTKFTYPSGKRRTAATTAKRREAEKNLDMFWQTVDEHYVRNLGKPIHELLSGILVPRELDRTPEWVEPSPSAKPEKSDLASAITDEFPTFIIDDHPPERAEAREPIKSKVKTRGQATERTDETVPKDKPLELPLPTIIVSKRAHKVFSAILHNSPQDSVSGEIPWTEFLHALSSAGFAIQKQYGSAWLFTPLDTTMRPIMFHEPHPSNKIPIQIAWRHGNRLRKTYGWNAETFVMTR